MPSVLGEEGLSERFWDERAILVPEAWSVAPRSPSACGLDSVALASLAPSGSR